MDKYKEDTKRLYFYTKNSVKCEHCGHTEFLGKQNYKICSWCGYYIFKNKKIEFNFRMGKRK